MRDWLQGEEVHQAPANQWPGFTPHWRKPSLYRAALKASELTQGITPSQGGAWFLPFSLHHTLNLLWFFLPLSPCFRSTSPFALQSLSCDNALLLLPQSFPKLTQKQTDHCCYWFSSLFPILIFSAVLGGKGGIKDYHTFGNTDPELKRQSGECRKMLSLLMGSSYRAYIKLQQHVHSLHICKSGVTEHKGTRSCPLTLYKNHNILNHYQRRHHQALFPVCNLNTLLKQSTNFLTTLNFGVNC